MGLHKTAKVLKYKRRVDTKKIVERVKKRKERDQLHIVISKELKKEFIDLCSKDGLTATDLVVDFIIDFVASKNKEKK